MTLLVLFQQAEGAGLVANNLSTGAPTVGAPELGQVHVFTATGIATGAPTVASPALTQAHALTAAGIATGAPTVGAPALGQINALTSTGIATGAPTVGTPAAGLLYVLTANSIATGAPTVGTPEADDIGAIYNLSTAELATGAPTVGAPALGQHHQLRADDLTVGPFELDQPGPAPKPSSRLFIQRELEKQARARQREYDRAMEELRRQIRAPDTLDPDPKTTPAPRSSLLSQVVPPASAPISTETITRPEVRGQPPRLRETVVAVKAPAVARDVIPDRKAVMQISGDRSKVFAQRDTTEARAAIFANAGRGREAVFKQNDVSAERAKALGIRR